MSDRQANWLSGWTDLQTRYLGATTTAALDSAKGVYDKTHGELRSKIDFECEPGGGGRCNSSQTYWYGVLSDFHLCPSWRNQPTDSDRTVSMLAGLYGYVGGLGDSNTRAAGIMHALRRDLTIRFWS